MSMRILTHAALATLLGLTSCGGHGGGSSNPLVENLDTGGGNAFLPGGSNDNGPGDRNESTPVADAEKPSAANPVPEPATMMLFGLGITTLAVYRRRRDENENDIQTDAGSTPVV